MNMIRNFIPRLRVLVICVGLVSAFSAGADTIQVTNNLTGTVTWRNTNEYVLNGFIYVLTNGVLNIEPGTVIRGKAGSLDSAALFITQGAKSSPMAPVQSRCFHVRDG